MTELFGKQRERADLMRRVGSLAQVAGIREYAYNSGYADGVKALEVDTGLLRYELLASRCLDVSRLSYRGIPLAYISKSGVRHPAFYNKVDPTAFHGNFLGGALSTCGLHNIGPAAECCGRRHQLHGHLANIPAEKVSARELWDGDDCLFEVEGVVRHGDFYHEDLILRRRVTSRLGGSSLLIEDEVENLDFAPSPCLILYHMQFGYPILDESTRLLTSPRVKSEPRPGTPDAELDRFDSFGPPVDGAGEVCFYHAFRPDASGMAGACLFNPGLGERGVGVYVRQDLSTLPKFVQWKMLRSREYVCGLEPAATLLDNRSEEEMRSLLLHPLEKRKFRVELGVVEGEDECRRLLEGK